MTKFPDTPFKLNEGEKGDQDLLDYLKDHRNFKYLERESKDTINGLPTDLEEKGLQSKQKELEKLWPQVLTDALLALKTEDQREYDKRNPDMKSFFHKESLGIGELTGVLEGFSEFEGMMYGASPSRYREHLVHSFRVWIIGQGILKKRLKHDLCTYEDEGLKIKKVEWEAMWAIVALCHDLGYPLSAIEKINEKARRTFRKQGLRPEGDLSFKFAQQMLPFHDTVIQLMSSKPVKDGRRYLTHLQNKYYLKLLKSFDNLDHGVVSSLLISRALVYFLESDLSHDNWKNLNKEDARQFLIRREILRSIAAHTCQDIYHLHFNTLSFLLYIVDEVQCWGRPTLEELQYEPRNIEAGIATVNEYEKDKINIEIATQDDKWDPDLQKQISLQVGKLHRMLRLAVDTPELVKRKLSLSFKVSNKKDENSFLELKNGKIHKKDNFKE